LAGALVIAQTTSADKADQIRALGAHTVIVHARGEDFSNAVKKANGGLGVDVAIDNVGSQLFEPIRRSMGTGGRWIMIGQLTGEFVPFNPAQLFLKNVSMLSATSTTRKQLDDCLALVARGVIKPIVSLALPLEQAARAHELVETGKAAGRIVLPPNGETMKLDAAIVGIGNSSFGRGLPDSQLRLAATAFKNAIVDAGIERHDVDGLGASRSVGSCRSTPQAGCFPRRMSGAGIRSAR